MHKLIGFTGKAGVGKTVTSNWFVEQHGFVKLAFADPLKEALAALTGLPIENFKDIELKEKEIPGLNGHTPRTLMQKMATEFVREMVDPDFWLWRMRHMISDYSDNDIVIDDVRFENEAKMIRDNGGVIIHLHRMFESPTKHIKHKSETGIFAHPDDIIINSIPGSIEQTAYLVSHRILD